MNTDSFLVQASETGAISGAIIAPKPDLGAILGAISGVISDLGAISGAIPDLGAKS